MRRLDRFITQILWLGMAILGVSLLVIFALRAGSRQGTEVSDVSRLERLQAIRTEAISLTEPQVLEGTSVLDAKVSALSERKAISEMNTSEFAMHLTERLLIATRGSDRKLTTPKAEALLQVLREELALPPKEGVEDSIQAVRARLVSLTEMMVEVQSSLGDVRYKVEDVKAVVDQLPEILKNQRDHMYALDNSIQTLIETTATKSELQLVEHELATFKWATTAALGALFTVVLWMAGILVPRAEELRVRNSTQQADEPTS
jgi:hypothetical protein